MGVIWLLAKDGSKQLLGVGAVAILVESIRITNSTRMVSLNREPLMGGQVQYNVIGEDGVVLESYLVGETNYFDRADHF